MIIGQGQLGGKRLLLLGLSKENINRLRQDDPILLTRETHGDGVPKGWKIMILYGDTEGAMEQKLRSIGMVQADTPVHQDPRLNS